MIEKKIIKNECKLNQKFKFTIKKENKTVILNFKNYKIL